jgi:hypothetical protein
MGEKHDMSVNFSQEKLCSGIHSYSLDLAYNISLPNDNITLNIMTFELEK